MKNPLEVLLSNPGYRIRYFERSEEIPSVGISDSFDCVIDLRIIRSEGVEMVEKTEEKDKQENKDGKEKKDAKERRLKDVFVIKYYIKDLNLDRYIETNMPELKNQYEIVFLNGDKVVLEGTKSFFPKVTDALKEMKVGEEKTIKLKAKDAYGLRNRDLLRVIPFRAFKENNLRPVIGMTLSVDGMIGIVRSVSGGRVLVDFNSPYADHDVEVYVKLISRPEGKDRAEKVIKSLLPSLKIKDLDLKDKSLKIIVEHKNPQGLEQVIKAVIQEYLPIEKVIISSNDKEKSEEK